MGRMSEGLQVVFVYLGSTWYHLLLFPSVQAGGRELCHSRGHTFSSAEAALSKGKDEVPMCHSSSLPSSPSD